PLLCLLFFSFPHPLSSELYPLSLHDALPILGAIAIGIPIAWSLLLCGVALMFWMDIFDVQILAQTLVNGADSFSLLAIPFFVLADRKSTRLNSSHVSISYAVFCLKKKTN